MFIAHILNKITGPMFQTVREDSKESLKSVYFGSRSRAIIAHLPQADSTFKWN